MVFLCIASIVWSSIALHGIALHRIAWHCMVLQRLHGVVQIIWRAGELPRSASIHFNCIIVMQIISYLHHKCDAVNFLSAPTLEIWIMDFVRLTVS